MIKKILIFTFLSIAFIACKTTSPKEKDTPPPQHNQNQSNQMKSRYQYYKDKISQLKEEAVEVEANLFYPNLFDKACLREADADTNFYENKEELMTRNADKAIEILADIIKTTKDNRDKISFLRNAIEIELDKGENERTYSLDPDLYTFINNEYFKGTDAYRNKNMTKSLEAFSAAYYASQRLLSNAEKKDEQEAVRLAITDQLKEIERITTLKVADNQGVVTPSTWDGYAYLNNPKLQNKIKANARAALENQQKAVKTVKELLDLSRSAWELALVFNEAGQMELAKEQLILSRQYSNTYAEYAILDVFLVRANQRPRDTLWKIASIYYKNPFAWPLIWMRNRALIKDPDIIYPGWKIAVPTIPQS